MVCRLQPRRHFARLHRIHPVIVFAGQKKDRRIIGPILHMVVRRIGVERFELIGIFHGAEFGDVECTIGIEFDAQHIVDADEGNHGAKELRALGKVCAHEQPAIAAAHDGQMRRGGVFVVNQVLSAGDEVVEDILFVGEVSGLVPLFAILASAAQNGRDEDAALVEPEARAGPYEVGLFRLMP